MVITAGFKAVQLQYFFTAGEDEVKCWQIRKGTKAPQAAGAIHTDFERGFICAEVMKFDELKELGTEAAVKAAGARVCVCWGEGVLLLLLLCARSAARRP